MKFFKLFTCLCITTLVLTGCGRARLEDGRELVLEMEGINITANDLYNTLKNRHGLAILIDKIDSKILELEYETTEEMKRQIESQILSAKQQTGPDFLEAIRQHYGLNSEKEFFEFLEMNMKREKVLKDYAKTLITDEEIEEYYNDVAIGDIKASHILIRPEQKDSFEEMEEAEQVALNKALEIIEQLEGGADFAELAMEHSQCEGSAVNGGDLGFFNRNSMVKEFEEESIKLNIGEYTKTPVKTIFGYHIILKTDEEEKGSMEELKDNIINILSNQKLETVTNLRAFAIEALREKYNLKIHDSELKKLYEEHMRNLKNQ